MTQAKDFNDTIGYELIRPIAEGGMGEVYEARQSGNDGFSKQVVIKFIRPEFAKLAEFRRNFIGEARLVADLVHPNVVQIYHLGKSGEDYFMVMEYVEGLTLETFILQHRALKKTISPKLATFIISRVCRALAYAHSRKSRDGVPMGIVHRDVNPKNILLGNNGDVKLTDFGIAKAYRLMHNAEGRVIAGKDEYLSPEQAKKQITDNRADLFPCGIILSEMLCGKNIFDTGDPEMTRDNILNMKIPSMKSFQDGISEELDQVILKILHRDKCKRFQSAEELMMALEFYLYRDGYGPTHEKLSKYLNELFINGLAFVDDRQSNFNRNGTTR